MRAWRSASRSRVGRMSRASLPVFCASDIGSRLYPEGVGAVNLSVTTLRAMAVYLQWVSGPPVSESAMAPPPGPPSPAGERERNADGPTRFSGWGRLSLGRFLSLSGRDAGGLFNDR